MNSVSIVIPCFNPDQSLLETIGSARAQEEIRAEIVLVNDGSSSPESARILEIAAGRVDKYIEQPNRGVSAARNAGMRAATADFLLPLDSQDLLEPSCAAGCLKALGGQRDEIAFAFSDYRVFGERNYVERLPDYNLYDLLETNTVPYSALLRREAWEASGGYDETLAAHEDWEFWLALGARGQFGLHVDRALWAYRMQPGGLSALGRKHHAQLAARIRAKHPALYSPDALARIKTFWRPAVCVAGTWREVEPTIGDWHAMEKWRREDLLADSQAEVFLFPGEGDHPPEELELAALAGLDQDRTTVFPNGSIALPRAMVKRSATLDLAQRGEAARKNRSRPRGASGGAIETLWRHLDNAEMLSGEAWRSHPLEVASRAIPLRWKERLNAAAGRRVFDLSFYLRFQPASLVLGDNLVRLARYLPKLDRSRHRVALITPHLGPGGAESVLMDVAAALDRARYQILLIATQSGDQRSLEQWRAVVDQIYDLGAAVPPRFTAAAIVSIISNWQCGTVLVQNSLAGYEVIADLKTLRPDIRVFDLVHAVSGEWDVVKCTAAVADRIDRRIAVSRQAHDRLAASGPAERILRIANGIDLQRFTPRPEPEGIRNILFAGRLDPVKRPLLLVEIARAMKQVDNVRFVIAGDGPEGAALRRAAERAGVIDRFDFLGFVADVAPVFAKASVVILTSSEEGVPLVVLEAFASARPVVASDVGAIRELVDEETGVVIRRGRHEARDFARALTALLSDPAGRAAMGQCGRRRAEAKHSREAMQQAYRELFALDRDETFSEKDARPLPAIG